ncbi:MAG TPA: PhzF family phenazine biosynthesis protein [Xanthomonadales bacterium]|nr:PhzF family phenazine biosynthesis protein [Xanthomonadales bacterium]
MRAPIFQLDAFTTKRFRGNPAAVVALPEFPTDHAMRAIAAENNLSETAFIVAEGGDYRIRWFTPTVEVPLCGHATLASAAVVMERIEPERRSVVFHSASGPLTVRRTPAGYAMDFPARPSQPCAVPALVIEALAAEPEDMRASEFNYLAVLGSEPQLRRLTPDMGAISALDRPGLIVTARGAPPYDFTSRYFAPAKGIPEDPVTGGAHCMLAPYWAERLGKSDFRAYQASARGGEMFCRLQRDRVELEGACVFYLEGEAQLDGA